MRRLNILLPSINSLKQSKLFKSILILSSGTAAAQLITLIASPLITRLYSPEALGVLGSFLAVLAILLPIAACSYPMAIVLPKRNSDAVKIANLSLRIAAVFSLLLLVIFLFLRTQLNTFLGMTDTSTFLIAIAIPCAVFISVFLVICTQWVIRHQLFKLGALVIVIQSIVFNSLKVILGYFFPFGKTLILLSVVGVFFHSLLLFFIIKFKQNKRLWIPIGCRFNITVAKEYNALPKYRSPQGLLANLNQNMPVILLVSLFGPIPAGLYTLCRSTLLIPITLIAKSVNDVLFPKINEFYNNSKAISPLIIKATVGLALLALPPLVVFVVTGPDIFTFVFGDNWAEAGVLSQLLALRYYFGFINRACVAAIPVLRLERFLLINSIMSFFLSGMGFYLGYHYFSDYLYAIAFHSLLGILPQILIISFVIFSAKKHDRKLVYSLDSLKR